MSTKKYNKLFTGVSLCCAMFATSFAQAEDKVYRLKLAETWGPNTPILGETTKNMVALADSMSNGRLKITIDSANKHKAPFGVFDMVRAGQYDIGHSASYYWKGKVPNTLYFTTMPFGMTAPEQYGWFYHGEGQDLMNEVYGKFGMYSFPGGNTGVQMGGWYNKKITSLEDFKGLKMRIGSIAGKVLSEVGVTTVMLPPSEIFPSLERGVVDAAEFVGPVHDILLGLYKVAPYYYTPGWHEPGPVLDAFFNKEAYNALPKHLQKMLDIAAAETNIKALAAFDARSSIALEKLIKEHNVQVEVYPDDVMAKLKDVSKKVIDEEAKKDPFAQKVHDDYMAFQKQVGVWGKMSEKVYWNTMA